jgi:DnaK suppressor protein
MSGKGRNAKKAKASVSKSPTRSPLPRAGVSRAAASAHKATTPAKSARTAISKSAPKGKSVIKSSPASSRKSAAKTSVAGAAPKGAIAGKTPYSAAELETFRQKLLAIRESVDGQIGALKEASLERRDKVITEEDGTDAFDRDLALNLASSEQNIVFEIDEALRRIENGTYGVCESTGRKIHKARLDAIPYTRLSVEAQQELEKDRGGRNARGAGSMRSTPVFPAIDSMPESE